MSMDEKGVSPVIGVILMVAITVILAAVIASFLFAIPSEINRPSTANVVVERVNDTTIKIVLTNGEVQNCELKTPSGDTSLSITSVGDFEYANVAKGTDITITCEEDGRTVMVYSGGV